MTLAKHIKRGETKGPGLRAIKAPKHTSVSKKMNAKKASPDSSESRTKVLADHPSNRVGGLGRKKFRAYP